MNIYTITNKGKIKFTNFFTITPIPLSTMPTVDTSVFNISSFGNCESPIIYDNPIKHNINKINAMPLNSALFSDKYILNIFLFLPFAVTENL